MWFPLLSALPPLGLGAIALPKAVPSPPHEEQPFLRALAQSAPSAPVLTGAIAPPERILTPQTPTPGPNFLELGRQRYVAGQLQQALDLWQQGLPQASPHQRALGYSYICLVAQDLGRWGLAEESLQQGWRQLAQVPNQIERGAVQAHLHNSQGTLQLAQGQAEAALASWQQAARLYQQTGDLEGLWGSELNQIQALQTLGLYRQAQLRLEALNQRLTQMPESPVLASTLQSLGTLLQVVGNLEESERLLAKSFRLFQRFQQPQEASSSLFSWANTLRAQQRRSEAQKLYQQASSLALTPQLRLEAQLNQLSLELEGPLKDRTQQSIDLDRLQQELEQLPASRRAIYARVNFAESLAKHPTAPPAQRAQVLATAVQQARQIQDSRAESYALGALGQTYEQTQQWAAAAQLTQEALGLAQMTGSEDIAYRWHWQLGRIRKQQGQTDAAIAAYSKAVSTLQSLRSDLLAINQELQFSFRDRVEPVYRELVALLVLAPPGQQPSQENLRQARELIEALHLSELENYFRSACLDLQQEKIESLDPKAAVVYPILLRDRLSVIVSLPNRPLKYHDTSLAPGEIPRGLEELLASLNPAYSDQARLQLSQQLYRWILAPVQADLDRAQIESLVFVLDGELRNIPMAVLHDGQRYLIERYNLALTPGLQLLGPKPLPKGQFKALLAGLTEGRQGFVPLPGVALELQQIAAQVNSEQVLNQNFTSANLRDRISTSSYPVIHLATHGQFSSNVNETFILTWDQRLRPTELTQLLRGRQENNQNPVELLVFSACQTAEGDRRATLGLAGLAVRSGARSTLATLWAVQDASTAEFMTTFYRALAQPQMGRAAALRQAQLAMLKHPEYRHPYYWAPFVLIGNWL
jgi:CHAT domain-containing protein